MARRRVARSRARASPRRKMKNSKRNAAIVSAILIIVIVALGALHLAGLF